MSAALRALGPYSGRGVALACVVALYAAARLPRVSSAERLDLATPFRFARHALPDSPTRKPARHVRSVHPDLERISSWISSVGASAALADLDGDALANDMCWVDTRTDEVIVAPVPGRPASGGTYAPFTLDAEPLDWDPDTMAPMGCLPADLNADGATDVLVYYWGRTPIVFLYDRVTPPPLGPACYRAQELVPRAQRWYTNAATIQDFDGDGALDVLLGNYFPDGARILEGRGPGGQRLRGAYGEALDEPQEMQASMSRSSNGGRNRLLLCQPSRAGVSCADTPAFDDQTARAWTLAVGAADLDGDQLPEIYFANDFGADRLLHNRSRPGAPAFAPLVGAKSLTTANSKVLGRDSFKGMGIDFGDVNADGVFDMYVSNIAAPFALEESHFLFVGTGETGAMPKGRAPFRDQAETLGLSRSGWAWDARLADLDNDGRAEALQAIGFVRGLVSRWPELHELAMGNDVLLRRPGSWPRFQPGDDLSGDIDNALFTRDARGLFFDVADLAGLEEREVSRAIALADTDADGDLDLAFGNQWGASSYYRNDLRADGRAYLALRLLLPTGPQADTRSHPGALRPADAGRPAIGAVAVVELPEGGRRLVGLVDGGNGHSGRRSSDIHFGLGRVPHDRPLRVSLRWRDAHGRRHAAVRELTPGWHTLVLGDADSLEG